jgi:DNA polymerase-3 subunit gamma/tau
MSYQVLARKWRPKKFTELMGQEHVVTVLVNALEQERLHHAYLFTGTRGVGKTTIARIFAKSLNCEQGITSSPCGTCDTCQDIDMGRFVDLLEIDAASRTKVDDTREILDNVQYAPTRGRYKVYLIDEVHMLSRSSFNALLKTLEEPPEHVKFILATTDPQKLPVTVLSRCLQFHLKALTVKQIEEKVREILQAESVPIDGGALTLLAKAARGSMRDCLSLTDQAIAQGQGSISLSNTQQMLGGVDQNWVYKILIALIKQDAKALMSLSLEIASYAPNYSRLTAEFIQLLHQIAMIQIVGNHFDLSAEHQLLVDKFCQAMSPEDIQLYYQIVLTARKDLPYAADEQAAFDMLLLRLLAFKPIQNANNLSSLSVEQQAVATEIDFTENLLPASNPLNHAQQVTNQKISDSNLSAENTTTENVEPTEVVMVQTPIVHQNNEAIANDSSITEARLNSEMAEIEQVATTQHIPSSQQVINSPLSAAPIENPQAESEPLRDVPNTTLINNEDAVFQSPIEAALSTRNMLRSRKKALEGNGKKSSDAKQRQESSQLAKQEMAKQALKIESQRNVPSIDTVPDQPFNIKDIDPAKVRSANQVDKWANMIDAMSLGGRLRQLAIHSTVSDLSTDNLLILNLDHTTKHLVSDVAHKQLEANIAELLERSITVELNIVEETKADPYQIQSNINDKRYDYVKQLLEEDELVISLKNIFQAEIDEKTIVAL